MSHSIATVGSGSGTQASCEENGRLKKLVAKLSLDKAVLQDVLPKKFPGRRS
jgi:hypothetical protein